MTDHEHDLLEALAEEYEPELLTLETQDGGELTLEVLSELSYGGAEYLVGAEYTQQPAENTALYFFEIREDALYPVEDEELLEDAIVENKQAIEMANVYSSILDVTMEAYSSVISNNLNTVMKVLTSLTIIMTIPTMIFSFFF